MKPGHLHISVRDLDAAVQAFRTLWNLRPGFQNKRMATFEFGDIGLLIDRADEDSVVTIAFDSEDCERDFRAVVAKGAQVIQPPDKKPWGVCAAYIRGPGKITFEIEQQLKT